MTKAAVGPKTFLLDLTNQGQYIFTTEEAQRAFGTAESSTLNMLGRLRTKGLIATPVRTYHAIVLPEFKEWSCLPPTELVAPLFTKMNLEYYVGLLTAAYFHGAITHQPASFQIVVKKNRQPIHCGKTEINFIARVNLGNIKTQKINSKLLPFSISSPEATALDLVVYPRQVGGLSVVIKTLRRLADKLNAKPLLDQATRAGEMPHIQRLGLLLDQLNLTKLTGPLGEWIDKKDPPITPLVPGVSKDGVRLNERWRVVVNNGNKL